MNIQSFVVGFLAACLLFIVLLIAALPSFTLSVRAQGIAAVETDVPVCVINSGTIFYATLANASKPTMKGKQP